MLQFVEMVTQSTLLPARILPSSPRKMPCWWHFPVFSTQSKDSTGTKAPRVPFPRALDYPWLPRGPACSPGVSHFCKATPALAWVLTTNWNWRIEGQSSGIPFFLQHQDQVFLKFIPTRAECNVCLRLVPEIPLLELTLKDKCITAVRWMITYIHWSVVSKNKTWATDCSSMGTE